EKTKFTANEAEALASDASFQRAAQEAALADERARESRSETSRVRTELDYFKQELMGGITRSSDLTSKSAGLISRVESAEIQLEKLKVQSQGIESKHTQAKNEALSASDSVQSLLTQKDFHKQNRDALSIELQKLKKSQDDAYEARVASEKNLNLLRSKLEGLKELNASHEGFGDGPKAALEYARSKDGADKLLALASFLEISDGYETAIEGWLEDKIENLVSSDTCLAMETLDHLREEKLGRASIQVAPTIAYQAFSSKFGEIREILENAGFQVHGELVDFVGFRKTQSELEKLSHEVAARLLNHACVVESFEPMAAFIGNKGFRILGGWSVVAKDGSVLTSDGNLRGGSIEGGGATTLIRIRKMSEELDQQILGAEQNHRVSEVAFEKISIEVKAASEAWAAVSAEIQNLDIQGAALERDVLQMNRV
ncbi:MAG: hypothetical protein AABZ55_00090, partial [Bdellovibrionota bacterium]